MFVSFIMTGVLGRGKQVNAWWSGDAASAGARLKTCGLSKVLNLKPYTLHSTPSTLNPTPYILHPALYSLVRNPKSYTIHPPSYTLHPTPYNLQPTPYTIHPDPTPCTPTGLFEPYRVRVDTTIDFTAVASTGLHAKPFEPKSKLIS